jgi:RNA polymerase sigma-70 factor (ECF subfamily)
MDQDLVWVEAIKERRDPEAFSSLYDAYSPIVYRVCLLVLRDEHEAQDLVQEVFAHFWNKSGAFDPAKGRLHTWFSLLARNKSIDRLRHLRRKQKKVTLSAEGSLDGLEGKPSGAGTKGALDQAIDNETRQRALKLLKSLPAAQSEVLVLAFYRGLSHSEIAGHLKLPLGTVKTRLRRGLAALNEKMGPDKKGWLP